MFSMFHLTGIGQKKRKRKLKKICRLSFLANYFNDILTEIMWHFRWIFLYSVGSISKINRVHFAEAWKTKSTIKYLKKSLKVPLKALYFSF